MTDTSERNTPVRDRLAKPQTFFENLLDEGWGIGYLIPSTDGGHPRYTDEEWNEITIMLTAPTRTGTTPDRPMNYEGLPLLGTPFTPVETYVHYDGRQTFAMRSTSIPDLFYLVNTVEESDDSLTALMVAVDTANFEKIRSGAIPFRDVFEKAGPFALSRIDWTFDTEGSTTVEIIPMRGADVPGQWLPTVGVALRSKGPIPGTAPSANITAIQLEIRAIEEHAGRMLPSGIRSGVSGWTFPRAVAYTTAIEEVLELLRGRLAEES